MKRSFLAVSAALFFLSILPQHASAYDNRIWDFLLGGKRGANEELRVHFLDVGQGDSMLIETPQNKTILIDGGDLEAGERVLQELRSREIKKLDLVVATHPDIDHIGGLLAVLKHVKVKHVLDSGKLYTTKTYEHYLNLLHQFRIPVTIAKEDSFVRIDPALSLKILNTYTVGSTNNQSSIVMQLHYRTMDFLFTGDAEIKQEKRIIKKYDVQSEIYKVAHHGSRTGNSLLFLQNVKPETAVISYSRYNHYGHPTVTVMDNLQAVGTHVYSTANGGTITIESNGLNYHISSEKPHPELEME